MKNDVWRRSGLFYVKISQWKLGDHVLTRTSRVFCLTYWILKELYPKDY